MSRVSVSRVFKDAGELLGLTINTHSMRKSRGMTMYKDGVPVEKIAKVLNHSNTTSTLRYLGITQEEVLKTYDDYELWVRSNRQSRHWQKNHGRKFIVMPAGAII